MRRTFFLHVTKRLQFACDPLENRGVDRLEGWIRIRIEGKRVVGQSQRLRRRIEHNAISAVCQWNFTAGSGCRPTHLLPGSAPNTAKVFSCLEAI